MKMDQSVMNHSHNHNHCATASPCRRVFTTVFSIWFACVSMFGGIANAQSDGSDFEAPIIEHEPLGSGVSGNIEPFEATVVDNEELRSVSLFYRFAGQTAFEEIEMKPLASSSSYIASIDTSLAEETATAIEYYIRAEDAAGNLVLKGFAFEPLVRRLNPAGQAAVVTAEPVQTQTGRTVTEEPRRRVNWLYVALGALIVGGIAAGAGGGSDDDGGNPGPGGNCQPDCQVTLTIATP